MTRLQTALLLGLAALASLLVGRVLWDAVALPALGTLADLPTLVASAARSVPEWVWHTVGWTAFSSIWWLPSAFGARGWGCCERSQASA